MKRIFVCLFVFCVSVSSAQQPSPPPSDTVHVRRVFKFRGTLAPSPPAPIIGAVTLRFSMYDQPDGGAAYWQETQSVHPDAQGSYTVLLGETTPGGLPSRAFAASEDHWLGVQLSGNPEQPRILLVELPPTAAADSGTSAAHINKNVNQLNATERRMTVLLSIMFLVGLLLAYREIRKWWKARTELYGAPPFAKLLRSVPLLGRIFGATPEPLHSLSKSCARALASSGIQPAEKLPEEQQPSSSQPLKAA